MLRRSLLGAGLVGYAYDCLEGGQKINRSALAGYVAFATFVDYKYVLTYTDKSLGQVHKRVADRWLWCVQQNGGLYTKLAQAVSSMNHVLPPEYLDTLKVIQDHAPTVDHNQVEQVLLKSFGKTSSELFSYFEPEAIASASIAQVHRARLPDGTPVAVKIQKPAIAKQIEADLFMYRWLGFFLEKSFGLPLQWTIPYTSAQLRQETDFRIEANNSKLAEADIEPALRGKVSIPRVYEEFSNDRVLTCEWIEGGKS